MFSFMNFLLCLLSQYSEKGLSNLNVFGGRNFKWPAGHGGLYIVFFFIWFVRSIYFGCKAKLEDKFKGFVTIFDTTFCPYYDFFLRQGLYSPACLDLIWRSDLSQTHTNPPASVSEEQRLKVSTTMIEIIRKF